MTATASAPPGTAPTREAVMVQAGSENFPVAMRLLGERRRKQLLALYGVARLIDDAGDEATGDRAALLDWIESDIERIYEGATPEHQVNQALQPVVDELSLPCAPFTRLIEANRQDQTVDRYPTFDELLGYCRLSAAPVGELVLHVFRAATPDRIRLSDSICAGLQFTEHLQDVVEDRVRGRVYLPQEDLERFGCTDDELLGLRPNPAFTELMRFEVGRARELLSAGGPLIGKLALRPSLAVAGFVAGGWAALDAIVDARYDVLGGRPRPTRAAFARAFTRTARWH